MERYEGPESLCFPQKKKKGTVDSTSQHLTSFSLTSGVREQVQIIFTYKTVI